MDYVHIIIISILSVGFIICLILFICFVIKFHKNMSTSATPQQSTAIQRSKPIYRSPSATAGYPSHESPVHCPNPTAYSTSCLPQLVNEAFSEYSEPSSPKKPGKRVKWLLGTVCGQRDQQSEGSDTSINTQLLRCWLKKIENRFGQPGIESFGSPAEFPSGSSSLNNEEFILDYNSLSEYTSES